MTTKEVIYERPLIFTLDSILSAEYCRKLISLSENNHEYSQAEITVGHNQYITDIDIRNNDRVIFDDTELAKALFSVIKEYLPSTFKELWLLKGLNERFRFYRYGKGQIFNVHFDGAFKRHEYEKSWLTLIFYLNDDFTGGETTFFHYRGGIDNRLPKYCCQPKQGNALIFDHRQLHEGSEVTEGIKYVLRTDVMYHIPKAN